MLERGLLVVVRRMMVVQCRLTFILLANLPDNNHQLTVPSTMNFALLVS